VPDKYPLWLEEMFFRFAAIYGGMWTHSIQEARMLELKKAEWFETLGNFDADIIRETIADVKKLNHEYPSLQKFHEIASGKARIRKANQEMENRQHDQTEREVLEHNNPEIAERAREEIRKLCGLKSARSGGEYSDADEPHKKQ
jgi:hypothetical protein